MANQAFLWGRAGEKLTPAQVEKERAAADLLAKGAMDYSPVAHWSQGLNRVAQGLLAGIDYRRADNADADIASRNKELIANALSGGTPTASGTAAVSSVIPASSASAEIAATSPAGAAVSPSFANDGTELGGYLSDPALRAKLPAGMRNNNPGNIKFVGQKVPGIVGPSVNTDQGDPQAVFATPEAGMNAMFQLAKRKYDGGKKTANQLIAGNMGWTPGNTKAAANVAASMGLSPDDDINLNDPAMAAKFVRGLIIQEHGKSGALYPESMVLSAIGGQPPVEMASAQPQTATDAIEQQAPMPVADQGLSGEVAAFRGTPEAMAAFPGRQEPAMAAQQPAAISSIGQQQTVNTPQQAPMLQEMAQAQPSAQPSINPAIIEALSDPQATPQTRAIAQALLQQQQGQQEQVAQQQQWMERQRYEAQQKDADPLRRQQLELGQIELDQARQPKRQPLINAGNGNVYDPNTESWLQSPNLAQEKTPDSVRALEIRADRAGLKAGTPEYNQFMLSGGSGGTSLSVGPNGEVNFSQGGGGKSLTEAQGKDSFFATRMTAATPTLDKYEGALLSLGGAASSAIPMNLGNYLQSDEYQIAKDAGNDFVKAYLRKDSGAALTPYEEKSYGELLLPQPGDGKARVEAKRVRRQVAAEALKNGLPQSAVDNLVKTIKETGTDKAQELIPADGSKVPAGVDAADWEFMTPEDRKLFQ